jgi:N6-L-threonylcarbamoyladenine synthase
MEKDLVILAIETSCDETSVAIVKNGRTVLANMIYSQIDIHEKFGGVVPEVASRNHVEKISQIIDQALEEAEISFDALDAIGTTHGPGLVGALLVGLSTAKSLAYALDIPLIPVNHIEGHIFANFIEYPELEPPFLSLVVSGGHTHLVHVKDYGDYEIMGKTRDDAAGEAYDKVARTLGLGYPGGPKIDAMAKEGNPEAIHFTRTYLEKDTFDFSFSGIKSGVLNYVNSARQKNQALNIPDIAASFQASVVDVLTSKTISAAKKAGVSKIALAGGVAANSALRTALVDKCGQEGYEFFYPSMKLCTDNAAMIGCVAYYDYLQGVRGNLYTNAIPNLKIGDK